MPSDQNCPPKTDRPRGERSKLGRMFAGLCLFALVVSVNAPPARAADDGATSSGWTKFMQFMGLKESTGPKINYTERAPLVVPPSRDLPPPADSAGPPAADWPKDPTQQPRTDKAKAAAVVPGTAVQTPNPPWQKKPWYNPAGWFDKEEYASFGGEPVRQSLTDPPTGYRVPSPDQPYGIPPDKTKSQASASDFPYTPVTPPSGSSGGSGH